MSFARHGSPEKAKDLNFELTEYYKFRKNYVSAEKFSNVQKITIAVQFPAGFFIFWVYYTMEDSSFVNHLGQSFDGKTYAIFMTFIVVVTHHVHAYLNTRNWTNYLIFWGIFGISMLPLTLVL